jgi:hypothetical protein
MRGAVALLTALLLPAAAALADPEADFDAAALMHGRELQALLRTRGMTRESMPVTARRLTDALHRYYAGKGVGVLFYAHADGLLRAWVVGEDGIEAAGRTAISAEALVRIEADLKDGMLVDTLAQSRTPRLRGQAVPAPAERPDPRTTEAFAAATLFPGGIAARLLDKRHVVIVPVLNLGTIPFAALKPFGDGTAMVDRLSLSVAPSLQDAVAAMEKGIAAYGSSQTASFTVERPLIVGNPHFAEDGAWELPRLPGAEEEARRVAALVAGARPGAAARAPLTGDAATLPAVSALMRDADLLYFATHGVADAREPLDRSFIALAPDPVLADGLWTARQIQQTRLRADLAVLSACQTGLGAVQNAGIIGLARAFQLAGVPHVVMSLWSVYDDATFELMSLFIGNLTRGDPYFPAGALRAAMLELRKARPDPAEWASFVVLGVPY